MVSAHKETTGTSTAATSSAPTMPERHLKEDADLSALAKLTDLPAELRCKIVENIDDLPTLTIFSSISRDLRALIENDTMCQTKMRQVFLNFERDTPRSREIDPETNTWRFLEGLSESFMPCYYCNTFKPIGNFFIAQSTGSYNLKGCKSGRRFCIDCVIHGRAIDRVNELALEGPTGSTIRFYAGVTPMMPWKDKWVQYMPRPMRGLRLGVCRVCKKTSWCREDDAPTQVQKELELCHACYRAKEVGKSGRPCPEHETVAWVVTSKDLEPACDGPGSCWCGCEPNGPGYQFSHVTVVA